MRVQGILLLVLASACETAVFEPSNPDEPRDLTYQLIPSGDPNFPAGIVLQWTPPLSGFAVTYDVYARSDTRDDFNLRATTTSPSFHDAGYPQLQYYIQALDGESRPMGRSDIVEVDERNRLPAPDGLTSVTLNGAIQLVWDQNAYDADPQMFDFYRVYSTTSGPQGCDESYWALEGTTVSDGFLSRNLLNGETRCFAVSAISRDGHESIWSNVREDTPRFDARSVVLDASDVRRASSGFVFQPMSDEGYGMVVSDTTTGTDVVLERRTDGALWFRAARVESRIAQYGVSPISELTSIDRAPASGYGDAVRVSAGYGYVVRIQYADGVRYAAIRVVHAATDYVVFDFAFQSQSGSAELSRVP
jgi:hypothetical protein